MQPVPDIKDLIPLLESNMKGIRVIDYDRSFLTKPGDNYGSIMLKLTVNVIYEDSTEPESLELVAKLPVENPVLRVVFQPEMTFIKENNFYREIYPTILKFQRSRIVPKQYLFDVFATCCGVRNALHEDEIHYDDDAVLILENLYAIGYEIGDRLKGFSKEKALFILEKLAMFHALPVAIRRCDVKLFNEKIKIHLNRMQDAAPEMMNDLVQDVCDVIKQTTVGNENLQRKMIKLVKESAHVMTNFKIDENNIFNTICHGDFWTNNMLIRIDPKTEEPTDLKIVDFQVASFDSLAKDVFFFLMTSVQLDIVEHDYIGLLRHYYQHFEHQLKMAKCPLNGFTFECFMKEFKKAIRDDILHVLFMIKPLYKRDVPEMQDLDIDSFSSNHGLDPAYYTTIKRIIHFIENNKLV